MIPARSTPLTLLPISSPNPALGLLTTDRRAGKSAVSLNRALPDASLVPATACSLAHVGPKQAAAFSVALLTALLLRTCVPFGAIVHRIRTRNSTKSADRRMYSAAQIYRHVRGFLSLRPVFYTARQHCLFDALVLVEYLALFRIYPSWVFGVTASPSFAAHCWVECDNCILNGSPEFIGSFTPIMAL